MPAVVPVVCLLALLAVWSVPRLADDVTQSVSAGQAAGRLVAHVLVAIVPLIVLAVIAVRPPEPLLRRLGVRGLTIAAAVLAIACVPIAAFVTFYFGS